MIFSRPELRLIRLPVPLMTPDWAKAVVLSKMMVSLLAMLEPLFSEPVAPPMPTRNVPLLIVVPPV